MMIKRLYTDDTYTVIALSEQDAKKLMAKFLGCTLEDVNEECEFFSPVPSKYILRVFFECYKGKIDAWCVIPPFAKREYSEDGRSLLVSAPAFAWALFNRRGFLSSTEF